MITFYKASHILISEEDDLDYIVEKIKAGEDFSKLAREFSECDTAENGGSLGRFPSGSMDAEFEKALYHMKVGEIKSGVKTKFGFHIIRRES